MSERKECGGSMDVFKTNHKADSASGFWAVRQGWVSCPGCFWLSWEFYKTCRKGSFTLWIELCA